MKDVALELAKGILGKSRLTSPLRFHFSFAYPGLTFLRTVESIEITNS
jgi:hypothetical protein